jgi:cytochrome P450
VHQGNERPYPFSATYDALNLHPLYQQLLDNEPLSQVRLPYGDPGVLVTRYDDVKTVFSDPRFGRSVPTDRDQPRVTPEIIPLGLMEMDPPDHTRIRRLVAKFFTARRAEQQRPAIEQLASALIDNMIAAGPPADLVECFAARLPIGVICEMLGVPHDDHNEFRRWTEAMNDLSPDADGQQRMEAIGMLANYMKDMIAQRRAEPTDDLIGELVLARDEDDRLSEDELIFLCLVLLVAGYETTANQISNFVYLLLTHPDQMALLRERPELLPTAVEELLRFIPLSTLAAFPRYAKAEVTLSGGTVAKGQPVLTSTNAANRDPRIFADPDRLDITRPATSHLAFGAGPHHCLGASLARMELHVSLKLLIERLPGLRLAIEANDVSWKPTLLLRGPMELPVTW